VPIQLRTDIKPKTAYQLGTPPPPPPIPCCKKTDPLKTTEADFTNYIFDPEPNDAPLFLLVVYVLHRVSKKDATVNYTIYLAMQTNFNDSFTAEFKSKRLFSSHDS